MSPSPWLDRLRSSKGFPSVDAPSLDHFLSHHLPPFLPDSLPTHLPPRDLSAAQEGPCLLPRILSDLFCIAPSSQLPRSKLPRKQPNPRSFSLPLLSAAVHLHTSDSKTPVRIPVDEVVPSSNSDNTTGGVEFERTPDAGRGDAEEEGNSDKELTGYSRSEVTVIDTSCEVWKSDRVVFRRRNVWKIRAKKGKLRSYGRKKRSQGSHDRIHGITSAASGNNITGSNPEDACGNRLTKPSYAAKLLNHGQEMSNLYTIGNGATPGGRNSQNEGREEIGDTICTNSRDMQRHNAESWTALSGSDGKARKRLGRH